MSKIYFHSQFQTLGISGCERAMLGVFAADLLTKAMQDCLKDTISRPSPLRKLLPQECYLLDIPITETSRMLESPFERAAATWLRASFESHLDFRGQEIEIFALALNTMLIVGSDVVKLGARLHGQCELHAYIEQDDREWVASVIENGRAQGFLRPGMGWEELVHFLKDIEGNSGPLDTSYRVTRGFPSYSLISSFPIEAEKQSEWAALSDTWNDSPSEKKWADTVPILRTKKKWLQITPTNWNEFVFVHGMNGYQLNETLQEQQQAPSSPFTVTWDEFSMLTTE